MITEFIPHETRKYVSNQYILNIHVIQYSIYNAIKKDSNSKNEKFI